MKIGQTSPWGQIDYVKQYAEGIYVVGTPRHGGFKLKAKQNNKIPKEYRQEGGWYEEDCNWAIVAKYYPEHFPDLSLETIDQSFERVKSYMYQKATKTGIYAEKYRT